MAFFLVREGPCSYKMFILLHCRFIHDQKTTTTVGFFLLFFFFFFFVYHVNHHHHTERGTRTKSGGGSSFGETTTTTITITTTTITITITTGYHQDFRKTTTETKESTKTSPRSFSHTLAIKRSLILSGNYECLELDIIIIFYIEQYLTTTT